MVKINSPSNTDPIPDKRYFTIGEVAQLCSVKPHVLRYWEQEFKTLKPNKRRGNRRYYSREDVQLIRKIYDLLYHQGFTIQGARSQLQTKAPPSEATQVSKMTQSDILVELRALQAILNDV